MNWLQRARSAFETVLDLPSTDAEATRGRRLLNTLLLGVSAATVLMLAAAVIAAGTGAPDMAQQARRLALGIVVTLFGVTGISILRRRRSADRSSAILLLLLAIVAISVLPIHILDGGSLTLLAIPILLASLLLRPWASFVLATFSCLMIMVIGLAVHPLLNVPAMAAFLVLIIVSWLSTRGLERALENSRLSNRKLQASRARYRALFDGVPVGLYRIAPSGEFLDANLALVGMLGFPDRPSLLADSAYSLYVHPEDHGRWHDLLEHEGTVRDFQTLWLRHDGTIMDVRCNARLRRDRLGRMAYFEGSAEDITARKRAEQVLRALNEAALAMERALTPQEIYDAVAQAFDRLGLSCTVLLADENEATLSVQYVSQNSHVLRAAQQRGGLEAKTSPIPVEAMGPFAKAIRNRSTIFVRSGTRIGAHAPSDRTIKSTSQLVNMLMTKRLICAPLIVENKVIGVLAVQSNELTDADVPAITAFANQMAAAWHKAQLVVDLRESLQHLTDTQSQLLQAHKLESIGRLAGGIAHDFSNLLTVMQGHAQLALSKLEPAHPVQMHLSEIQTATGRAAKMTGQLLAFSRREILQKQILNVNDLIGEFSQMLARTIGEHIELQIDLAPRLGPTLVDGDALGRVLMNLVLNARDAMPKGGTVRIATAQVKVDDAHCHSHPEATPGDYVRLTVTDTGVGMDKETQQHLFEPFFTTKEPGSGTGLGLAMSYGIIKQHSGWIEVESAAGEGTSFLVYLPVHTELLTAVAEEPEAPALPTGDETVLLAEDEPGVQRFARSVLESLGYSVIAASDGEEAIEHFAAQGDRVDMVVVDAVMPRLSGSKAYAAMRGLRPDVPVLFITGYSEEIARLTAELGTGVNILRKPFGIAELAHRVRRVLDESASEATD